MLRPLQNSDFDPSRKKNRLLAWLIALAFFIAVAPTLPWQDFSNSMENLVTATAMEMHRGGNWLVPTLQGELRLAKPPLAAWLAAAAIRPQTMQQIEILDHNIRDRAFHLLALEVRLPALLAAALLIVGTFELGRAIRDSALGLASAAICASCYFLLRFSRYSTTDIQLALWVTWTNAFLAYAVVRKKFWIGFLGAGVSLGLAMMSKGPASLIESVLPTLIYVLVAPKTGSRRRWILPMIVGTLVFIATGFWWFVFVWMRRSNAVDIWSSELFRSGLQRASASVAIYLAIVAYMLPWSTFFCCGIFGLGKKLAQRTIEPEMLALFLALIPLIVLTFARDRQDRYSLPMIPAAAVVTAIGVREYLKSWDRPSIGKNILATLHWLTLTTIAVIVPILAGTLLIRQSNGQPWFTRQFSALEASLGAALVIAGILLSRRRPGALVTMTTVTMLVMQAVLFKGYCTSTAGQSAFKEMAEICVARYPDARYYNAHPQQKRPPTDLGVYLNRSIPVIADPSTIPQDERTSVLFMLQNKGEPDPAPPNGWTFVTKTPHNQDWWWAFVLPPS